MAPDCDVPTSSQREPEKVSELWFKDGNIIIQAGFSLYRVFMGVLAVRSNVFKDMIESCSTFRLPDSTSSSEGMTIEGRDIMDGVPFLRLQDSEADVTHFLKAIFDSGYFEPHPRQTTFSAIVGVLRLSHKYDVPYLRKRALEHLSYAYPTSLPLWETRHERTLGYPTNPESELLEAFLVLQLALEVKADWLIPSAAYVCCTYSIDNILALETKMTSTGSKPCTQQIFSDVQKLTLCAWAQIRSSYHFLPSHLGPFKSCIRVSDKCIYNNNRVCALIANCTTKNDMLFILDAQYWRDFGMHVCKVCLQESKGFYQRWRQVVWQRLPKVTGLGEWAELKAMGLEEGMMMCN